MLRKESGVLLRWAVFAMISTANALSEAECLECGNLLQQIPEFAVVNRRHLDKGCKLEDCTELRFSCQVGRSMRNDEVFNREGVRLRCQRFDGNTLSIVEVTDSPTREPTDQPTSRAPTRQPTTAQPTRQPTNDPTTDQPSQFPTEFPTRRPTRNPTREPTTKSPTREPTALPTTAAPSRQPTLLPSTSPTTFTPTTQESLNSFLSDENEVAAAAGASVAGVLVLVLALVVVRRRRRSRRNDNGNTPTPIPVGNASFLFSNQPGSAWNQMKPPAFLSNMYRQSVDYVNTRIRKMPDTDVKQEAYADTLPIIMPGPPPGLGPSSRANIPNRNQPGSMPPPRRNRQVEEWSDGERSEIPPPAPPRKRRRKVNGPPSSLNQLERPPPAPPRVRRKKRRNAMQGHPWSPGHQGEHGRSGQRREPPSRWQADAGDDDEDDEFRDVNF